MTEQVVVLTVQIIMPFSAAKTCAMTARQKDIQPTKRGA